MSLHQRILASLAAVVLGLTFAQSARAQISSLDMSIKPPAASASVAEQFLLDQINTERAMAGMAPLKLDNSLRMAAAGHAAEMARASTLSHRLQGEPDLMSRGSSAGAHFSRITENVAVGPSVVTMHGALMQSPHHRENILDDQVDAIGIAVVQAGDSLWAVEDFSHTVEQVSLDDQEHRVADLLRGMQLEATPSPEARATCGMSTGYVGSRAAATVRYSTGDLSQMPEALRERMRTIPARTAAVGACPKPQTAGAFASYNIAIVLYR
ncbi:CAP domain-containing protein [Terriglobus aquaticus]|uniref:CAP domain-containing protein n=1 Tax=Terriglobus aquaticus TaxID=940139 RepID=A0ABW9KK99_9BACT|nr:CAP domain-containing protein [Terriglobus aquaticus]